MNITVLAIQREKAAFFCRVADVWKNYHKITFVTTRYHSYRYIKAKGLRVYMLQRFIDENADIDEFAGFKEDATLMERKADLLNPRLVDRQYIWLCKCFKNYFACIPVDKLVIWNGSMLQGYIASVVADHFQVKKLFFETGNFPNKIFVDPRGVNAKSSLMDKDLAICEDYDEARLLEFLTEHKEVKEKVHLVPQAPKRKKRNYTTIYDTLYNLLSRHPIVENKYTLLAKLMKSVLDGRVLVEYDETDFQNRNYVLFPLQVSTDSQVIRNSDITIQESIDYALNDAHRHKLDLLIKPHPGEKNKNLISYIMELKEKHNNIMLTNANTYQLIRYCRKVVTINSTVGIEGLMYHKHVQVLGRTLYKKYCESDLSKPVNEDRINRFLYNYLFNYLVDGDYFGSSPLPADFVLAHL